MKLTTLALALLTSFSVMAADETDSILDQASEKADGVELADTVVRPDYIEIERLSNSKEIIVITKDQIQQDGNRTMTDALRKVPSITVGASGMNQIDIRGQGSESAKKNLQVLIDGAPITSVTSHPFTMSYDVIPVEQLERIEVIPGGGSVMYGSGAVGGIVSMTSSLQAMKEPRSTLWGEWNSKGYRAGLTAGTTFADNRGAVEFSASKLDRDLFFKNTYADTEYYSAGVRWNLTPTQQILLRASHMKEESQYLGNVSRRNLMKYGRDYEAPLETIKVGIDEATGKFITTKRPSYLRGDKELNMVSLSHRGQVADKVELFNDLYFNEGYYQAQKGNDKTMDIRGYGLRSKANLKYMDGGQLLVGIDLLHQYADLHYDNYTTQNRVSMVIPYNFEYQKDTYAIFAVNTNRWGKWELNEGLRYELTKWSFDKSGSLAEGDGVGESNRRNTAFDLSLAYLYSDTGRVYGRYERGYTIPDGIEIADQLRRRNPVTNKKEAYLVPTQADDEHYDIFEIGWREAFPWTTASVTLWYTRTQNQMSRFYQTGVNGLEMKTVNLLDTDRWGADVAFSQKLWRFTFDEAYSYTMGKTRCHDATQCALLDKDDDYTDKGLMKVPQHKLTLRANWDITDTWSANITYLYQGKYTNFIRNSDKDDGFFKGYELTDIGVTYRPNEHLQLYAGINNVFDKEYFEYGSAAGSSQTIIPGPERMYYIGMKAIW